MRVNYVTAARRRHTARIRCASEPRPEAPSLIPLVQHTPERRARKGAEVQHNARKESNGPKESNRADGAKRRHNYASAASDRGGRPSTTSLKPPRFVPVHRGVELGAPASPPRSVVHEHKRVHIPADARPRFAFACSPRPARSNPTRKYLVPGPLPPARARASTDELLDLDLTGAREVRRRRELGR